MEEEHSKIDAAMDSPSAAQGPKLLLPSENLCIFSDLKVLEHLNPTES